MTICCVQGCSEVAYHVFPRDTKLRTQWLKAIRRINYVPTKSTRICRNHFLESDYLKTSYYTGMEYMFRKRLNKVAVPSVFPWNSKTTSNTAQSRENRIQTRKRRKNIANKEPAAAKVDESPQLLDKKLKISDQTPQILDKTPESLNKTPENLDKTPAKLNKTPDNLDKTPEILDKRPLISVKTPQKLNETLSASEPINKLCIIKPESPVPQNTLNKTDTPEKKLVTQGTQTTNCVRLLSTDLVLSDNELVNFYTGLGSYPKFTLVLSTLLPMANNIEQRWSTDFGLSVEDQFLMLLIKLKRSKSDVEIGKLFGVSKTEVSKILVTWINFVTDIWQLFEIWPSEYLINMYMPDVFGQKKASATVITDGTNCGVNIASFFKGKCQIPGLLIKQTQKLSIQNIDTVTICRLKGTYRILISELKPPYVVLASKIFCICVILWYCKEGTVNNL